MFISDCAYIPGSAHAHKRTFSTSRRLRDKVQRFIFCLSLVSHGLTLITCNKNCENWLQFNYFDKTHEYSKICKTMQKKNIININMQLRTIHIMITEYVWRVQQDQRPIKGLSPAKLGWYLPILITIFMLTVSTPSLTSFSKTSTGKSYKMSTWWSTESTYVFFSSKG